MSDGTYNMVHKSWLPSSITPTLHMHIVELWILFKEFSVAGYFPIPTQTFSYI